MKTKRFLGGFATLCAALILSGAAWAQAPGSVTQAFDAARASVSPEIQAKVVSLYGVGTPGTIQKWYIIFYDPSVPSHGRAVLVENNKITKTYEARGGTTYSSKLTFDPTRITSETLALNAAQGYAAQHHIAYDSVRALLKETSVDKPFCWRVELVSNGKSEGYVYVRAVDDTVAYYEPAGGTKHHASSSSNSSGDGFGNDVKNTFLGIGGDLQEFFTGDRTVDK